MDASLKRLFSGIANLLTDLRPGASMVGRAPGSAARAQSVDRLVRRIVRARGTELSLRGADLRGARLAGIDVGYVEYAHDPDGSYLRNPCRWDLSGAKMQGANLERAILRTALLSDANLEGATLTAADLRDTDFSGANLKNANLSFCDLRRANLTNAQLVGANLDHSKLGSGPLDEHGGPVDLSPSSRLARAKLPGQSAQRILACRGEGATLDGAQIDSATLRWADLRQGRFRRVSLRGAELSHAQCEWAVFEDADLTGAVMVDVNLTEAMMVNARLSGANLTGAKLLRTNMTGVSLMSTNFHNVEFDSPLGILRSCPSCGSVRWPVTDTCWSPKCGNSTPFLSCPAG